MCAESWIEHQASIRGCHVRDQTAQGLGPATWDSHLGQTFETPMETRSDMPATGPVTLSARRPSAS
jgi:hypothetical protein